jgi:hypothetical protein
VSVNLVTITVSSTCIFQPSPVASGASAMDADYPT